MVHGFSKLCHEPGWCMASVSYAMSQDGACSSVSYAMSQDGACSSVSYAMSQDGAWLQ